jgi:hypothetical protein
LVVVCWTLCVVTLVKSTAAFKRRAAGQTTNN